MTPTFKVHMLPARQGDCLWIEYGPAQSPQRVLIDGGTQETYGGLQSRYQSLAQGERDFELLIVTHIDSDHIGGALPLLEADDDGLAFGDVWFNGWRHLQESGSEEFGPVQGEKLTTRLLQDDLPWNQAFRHQSVRLTKTGPLPVHDLPGGLRLTLLSPGADELVRLRPTWKRECEKAGLSPDRPATTSHPVPPGFEVMGPVNIDQLAQSAYARDGSPANGSSIAVLAEFEGKRVLLAGDAHAEVLLASIKRLAPGNSRLRLDAFKLPHHGSKYNLNRELLETLDCRRYLFSTDGTQFKHPDREAVARVIKFGGPEPALMFNYRTEQTEIWDNAQWMDQYGYSASYPDDPQEGLSLDLAG